MKKLMLLVVLMVTGLAGAQGFRVFMEGEISPQEDGMFVVPCKWEAVGFEVEKPVDVSVSFFMRRQGEIKLGTVVIEKESLGFDPEDKKFPWKFTLPLLCLTGEEVEWGYRLWWIDTDAFYKGPYSYFRIEVGP